MHESGTGGSPEYGVVSQLPFTSEPWQNLGLRRINDNSDEAVVGVYSVSTPNIDIQFTSGERSGLFKYIYHDDDDTVKVMVNASHHLEGPGRPWWNQHFVNGSVETKDENGYVGYTTISGGWGQQDPWTVYFCGEFNHDFKNVGSFKQDDYESDSSEVSSTTQDESIGLIFEFDQNDLNNGELLSRVGISFISTDQACSNIEDKNFDFDAMVQQNQQNWKNEVFDKFEIEDQNQTLVNQFYTNLYGCHLLPSNRTGENPNWPESAKNDIYYDDFFTIWDTFRSLNPLINVINPTRGSEIIQALINIYQYEGYAPDGRSANQNGKVQGGTNSDILMADAYVKKLPNIDWSLAYQAMVKNAEVAPPYKYDSFAPDASTKEGRGALPDWLEYGYITRNYTRSVTRTVEYSYNDFALSVLAKDVSTQDDYEQYLKRSANWQNLWNFNATAKNLNYTGFLQPRNADGSFNSSTYDPLSCFGCYWGDDEYEGKPIEYGWSVPFDMETLISFYGDDADADDVFIQRLNDMYPLHGSKIADVGNEPSFGTPFYYNYINQQYRSVELVRYIMNTYFKPGASGLPGNSDAGAMQSWVVFSMLGLYPISGTTTYLIASPFLSKITITLENGATVQIKANNLSNENIYVQSLKINGEDWKQNWVDHDTIFGANGGDLEFELGDAPQIWETGERPPSPGHFDK
ncbi:hypothetical protein SBY92_004117 [Candida maltosa Xu316]